MTKEIHPAEAIRALRETVARFGPDTERACEYVEFSSKYDEWGETVAEVPVRPHCIVGVVLDSYGVPLSELVDLEGQMIDNFGREREFETLTGEYLVIDPQALRILRTAQAMQDSHQNWGAALAAAEGVYAGTDED